MLGPVTVAPSVNSQIDIGAAVLPFPYVAVNVSYYGLIPVPLEGERGSDPSEPQVSNVDVVLETSQPSSCGTPGLSLPGSEESVVLITAKRESATAGPASVRRSTSCSVRPMARGRSTSVWGHEG